MHGSEAYWRRGNLKPMEDRQVDQLLGLAMGIAADGIVTQEEAEVLKSWLRMNSETENPLIIRLLNQVEQILEDGVLDDEEARDLHDTLMSLAGGGGQDGEEAKTATLPLDPEPREVCIEGASLVLTGTFAYGTRKTVQDATRGAGGTVQTNITKQTRYLVLGTYVTPAWVHQSFGRKIEKAMEYRDERGTGIRIVSEEDWTAALAIRDGT